MDSGLRRNDNKEDKMWTQFNCKMYNIDTCEIYVKVKCDIRCELQSFESCGDK